MAAVMRDGFDEEEMAVDADRAALLAADNEVPAGEQPRRATRVGVAFAALGLVAAVAVFAAPRAWQEPAGAAVALPAIQGKAAQPSQPQQLVDPDVAQRRSDSRPKLKLEQDLGQFVTADHLRDLKPGAAHSDKGFAGGLFDNFLESAGLQDELTGVERAAFKSRFIASLTAMAKESHEFSGPDSQYLKSVRDVLESQKPVVTEAIVAAINDASLGFTAKMQDWMVHESKQAFQRRLGRTPLPEEKAKELAAQKVEPVTTSREALPARFDAREQWPECADVIGRIHNQGICGSCWVFGALGPLDSRICIKTRNASLHFDGDLAMLSRGFAASCAVTSDGCMGGWEYYVYEYIERTAGIPSNACSPYFASGPGSEHFDSSMPAPPCPEECDATFPQHMIEDDFKPSGVSNYRLVMKPSADQLEEFKAAMYTGGPVAFGIYASRSFMSYSSGIFGLDCGFSANHAVHAIGWGEGYFLGQNSWGPEWGDAGRFKVAPCVPTDFTVPGEITEDHYPLPIPEYTLTTSSTTPPPAPDPSTLDCKTDEEGCITSPNWPKSYGLSEECIISYTFGKIDVKSFKTEAKFDYLMVNDKKYSGTEGPQGVVPVTNIVWSSDFSMAAGGWKICPMGEDVESDSADQEV